MEYLKEKDIVFRVFNEMQEYPKKSEQFSEILANVYVHFPDSFAKDYSVCVYSVLGHKGSGKEIDLLLRFIAAVSTRCSGDGTVPHFAPILVEDLLAYTKCKDRYVRQRCLVIINLILEKSTGFEIDDKLLQKLKSAYAERSRDRVISVRSVAATGLCLLQHMKEVDPALLRTISQNMRYEVNASIRAIYASSILIHPVTMESIVLRLRDDDLTVRVAMLKNLEHSSIQDLSLPLRHATIHCLQDRNDVIVKGAERVLGELLLNALFIHEQNTQSREFTSGVSLTLTELTELSSFYLYCAVRFLFEHGRESEIDSLIPDIPQFCGIVQNCLFSATMAASTQRVLFTNTARCLQYLEVTDDVCRQELLKTVRFLLSLTPGSNFAVLIDCRVVLILLQALLNILDTESSFLNEVALLISDAEDRMKPEEAMTGLTNEQCMMFLLFVVQNTFKLVTSAAFSQPEIQSFFDRVVKPNLQSPVIELRREAVKGLVLAAIMNRAIAFQYASLLLCMVLEEDEDVEVKVAATQGLTDILVVYGDMQATASQDSELGVSLNEVIEGLNLYIFHTNEQLQNVTCEALCKLFIFNKIRSINILSSLLLLLFDSATEKNTLLRQTLAIFFPSFCSPEIDKNCIFLEEAAIYTVKGIAEASIPDRYGMVAQLGRFFLTLMTMDLKKSEKRGFVASSDDEAEGGSEKLGAEYHRCVIEWLKKLKEIGDEKLNDLGFCRELVAVMAFVNEDLLSKAEKEVFNGLVMDLHEKISNQMLKRQLRSKNKALCASDPSLPKL
ncbi:hypothetical protein BLSTO_00355 [Blastocystis sp. subtype 1]